MDRLNGWVLAIALVSLSGAGPAAAQSGFGGPFGTSFSPPAPSSRSDCRSDDLVCRIDALERRLAAAEGRADSNGGDGRGRRGRSIDMTVEQDCIFDSCVGIATKLCTSAGFARGVPIEMRQNGAWQRIVRATCLD